MSPTPTLQVDGSFQPSESDTCLRSCRRSSGTGVGCISTALIASSRSECTVGVTTRAQGCEHGDGISCSTADANNSVHTTTVTSPSVRSSVPKRPGRP